MTTASIRLSHNGGIGGGAGLGTGFIGVISARRRDLNERLFWPDTLAHELVSMPTSSATTSPDWRSVQIFAGAAIKHPAGFGEAQRPLDFKA